MDHGNGKVLISMVSCFSFARVREVLVFPVGPLHPVGGGGCEDDSSLPLVFSCRRAGREGDRDLPSDGFTWV